MECSGADAYLQSSKTPADYKDADGGYGKDMSATSTITPKWDDSASEEAKLERLIVQKWIALFPNGQEGWSEIRRTGYPKVFALPVSTNGYTIHVANRIPYDATSVPVTRLTTTQLSSPSVVLTTMLRSSGGRRSNYS